MIDYIVNTALLTVFIIISYQTSLAIQNKTNSVLLNPMLLSMFIIIPVLFWLNISIEQFKEHTQLLNLLLEPAIVALGLPLYQQIQNIKKNISKIITILTLAIVFVMTLSFFISSMLIERSDIAISLALKSITTPIGIALTNKLSGIDSLTTLMITIAGLTGAIFGHKWLNLLNIRSANAQGLAIGCASHALGTSAISRISSQHAAFGSLAIVLSAIITAIIAPWLIPLLQSFIQ